MSSHKNHISSSVASSVRNYFNDKGVGKDWRLSGVDRTFTLEYMPIYRHEITRQFGIKAQFWMEEPSGKTATLKFEFVGGTGYLSLREALADDFRRYIFNSSIPSLLESKGSSVARIHLTVPMDQGGYEELLKFFLLVNEQIGKWRDTNLLNVLEVHGGLTDQFIDQFMVPEETVHSAEQYTVTNTVFARSSEVRRRVLLRAKGICEWCDQSGFSMQNGAIFLETHHVIPLSEGGADFDTNVVALCPNHHREAHYGANSLDMRKRLLSKLSDV